MSDVTVMCFSFTGVGVCQPAGGECCSSEIHLRPVSGRLLEPNIHRHTGTQRLCQGESKQREKYSVKWFKENVYTVGYCGLVYM